MGIIYHVAILVLQLKSQYTYWKLDFHHEPRQKIVLTDFKTLLPVSQDQSSSDPRIVRVGPPMWIKMPEHYVSPPFGA